MAVSDTKITATQISDEIQRAISGILVAMLPPAPPADGKCSGCDGEDFLLVEFGHERWSQARFNDGWHATTNGWDDWSEASAGDILVCTGCDAAFQSPEIASWT